MRLLTEQIDRFAIRSEAMDTPWSQRLLPLVACGTILYAIAHYVLRWARALTPGQLQFDDAYMFIRYANNFLAGHGHAWNPGGEQIYGSTSLLHFAVVTAAKAALSVDNSVVLVFTSALAGFAAVGVLVLICGYVSRCNLLRGNYLLWGAILSPLLLFQTSYLYHAFSGMDTLLSLLINALVILFTVRLVRNQRTVNIIPLVIAAYAAFLARPDNGLYILLFPTLAFLLLTESARRWRLLIAYASLLVLVLAVDTFMKQLIFGDPLPLPFYAKQSGFYEGYLGAARWNPIEHMAEFATVALPFVMLLIVFSTRRHLRVLCVFLLPVTLTFLYYFSVTQIMGGWGRYYYPGLAYLVVASAIVVDDRLAERNHRFSITHSRLFYSLIVIVLLLSFNPLVDNVSNVYESLFLSSPASPAVCPCQVATEEPLPTLTWRESIHAVAQIARDAPEGTTLALSESGFIRFC